MAVGTPPDQVSASTDPVTPPSPIRDAREVEEWLREDATPARATVYWVLALLLPLGVLIVRGEERLSSAPGLHLITESVAATLALVLGSLALVRYYTARRRTYLFIGTGFLSAGVLDAFHAFLSSDPALQATLDGALLNADAAAWTWLLSRVALSLFLFVSLLAWHQKDRVGKGDENETSVYMTAAGLTIVTIAFFFVFRFQLPPGVHPEWFYPRPQELLPASLFAAAFVGYLIRGRWRTDAFEHWLVITLLISALIHGVYMGFSVVEGDALYTAAHFLKVTSYLALLFGVVASVYLSARREHAALSAIRDMNYALGHEVTVRRDAEQVLQRSEGRLKGFLDGAHDLIQSTAPDGRIVYVNPAWEQTLGYSRTDLETLRLPDIVHPACRKRVMGHFERVLAGESVGRIEVDFVTSDDRVVTCSGSVTRFVSEGRETATQSIFRDVTLQRRTERDLASSRASLAAVVESTGDGIWSIDREQRLVTHNSAFALAVEAQTGREPQIGSPPEEIFREEDAAWYRQLHARALDGGRFSELREEVVGGEPRVFEVFGHPVYDGEGVSGAVMFGRDVTRRILAEDALRMAKDEAEAANRAKSQFLASMSHELRTPLNSVIGFANILLKNKRGNLEKQDLGFLDRILANGRHLLSLINEVLDLAKVESGRMEVDIEPTDLAGLIRETVQQLEGQAQEKRVRLIHAVPDQPVERSTDPARLKQVIINLIGNALKFSEDGEVTVQLEMEGERPKAIAVRDTGIGIPDDRLEAIFEAFQQADGSTSRKYGGTGLGLAISRSICLMLGYDLMVESEVGVGSTFSIVLHEGGPVAADSPREDAEEEHDGGGESGPAAIPGDASVPELEEAAVTLAAATMHRNGDDESRPEGGTPSTLALRVLVIDDDPDSRVLLSHYLRDFGCSVAVASSAPEGIESARAHPPDLITLDLMMPEMSGYEALRILKEDPELREVPVVVISAVATQDRGNLLGAVDLLTKPVEREDLLRVLWRYLARKRGGRVLLVDDDDHTRALLREYLEAVGVEVLIAENGRDALHAVDHDAPDAILLDLMMPVMDGITFLKKLRENPYHTGLPVVVLTAKELSRSEREILDDGASSVILKGDGVEAQLRRVLGTILPLGEG